MNTQRSRAAASASSCRSGRDVVGGQLERRERGVALVEVQHARLDPERAERADGAETEQAVLAEARQRVRPRRAAP